MDMSLYFFQLLSVGLYVGKVELDLSCFIMKHYTGCFVSDATPSVRTLAYVRKLRN
jgi:hypothetical protein